MYFARKLENNPHLWQQIPPGAMFGPHSQNSLKEVLLLAGNVAPPAAEYVMTSHDSDSGPVREISFFVVLAIK